MVEGNRVEVDSMERVGDSGWEGVCDTPRVVAVLCRHFLMSLTIRILVGRHVVGWSG